MRYSNLFAPTGSRMFIMLLVLCFTFSCANRGVGPQGGAKDVDPPVMVKSKPGQNALNSNQNNIEIEFDEIIQVQDIFKNVVISPPQRKAPVIRATGRKISVQLADSLIGNTTYTIDFGNSIMDNNEKNVLEDFSFAFSTGNELDTLTITGILIDSRTLDPVADTYVGIYANLSDTAFVTTPFLRMTKTNSKGEFYVKNVKEGNYHVFALKDQNSNYYFDQPAEAIAFMDSIVQPVQVEKPVPKADSLLISDSLLLIDSTKIDSSLVFKNYNIIMYQFIEEFPNQYLVKYERRNREKFLIIFNDPLTELPQIEPLDFDFENKYLLQRSAKSDTLTYWLTDTLLLQQDTLNFILHYQKTDSIGNLVPTQDTLMLGLRPEANQQQPQNNRRARRNEEKEQQQAPDYFQYTTNASKSVMEYYDQPRFVFSAPVKNIDAEKVRFQVLVDTLWNNIPYTLLPNDSVGLMYELSAKIEPEKQYRIEFDSAAITSIYDKITEKKSYTFKLRPFEEYSTLIINLIPYDEKIVLELLNAKDEVIRKVRAEDGGTFFEYLNPGDYYVRLFIDENMNDVWDTGKYRENRQPEKMYYFNKKMTLRANWDVEEDWNYTDIPVLRQKPQELQGKTTDKKK